MATRPARDQTMMEVVAAMAKRSTCLRRAVGAVAVNARGHILATGYNGVPSDFPHCNEGHPCAGATAPSGTNLDACLAVHAEISMLAQCRDVWDIDTVYVSAAPCVSCTKSLLSTSCRRIVFAEEYPARGARDLWLTGDVGRSWERFI